MLCISTLSYWARQACVYLAANRLFIVFISWSEGYLLRLLGFSATGSENILQQTFHFQVFKPVTEIQEFAFAEDLCTYKFWNAVNEWILRRPKSRNEC